MNIIRNLPNFEPVLQEKVQLHMSSPLHLQANGQPESIANGNRMSLGSFENMVLDALGQTSMQILDSQLLQQQAIVSPDSVDPSTMVVSMLKADTTLSMTKAVIDRATTAYKELTTLR